MVSRSVVASLAAVTMAAFSPAAAALADPPATQVITTLAVGPDGQPMNGYREAPSQGDVPTVDQCTTPSPSAVADNVYYCSPGGADAGTCWPSTPGSLLCIDNPWDRRLHRVRYGGPLPPVHPTATPDPFALLLEDGTRCLFDNGGPRGGRDDGYVGVYACGGPGSDVAVLWLPSRGAGTCIDRSGPVWTVKVGAVGAPTTRFPEPQTRAVREAWFAGSVG